MYKNLTTPPRCSQCGATLLADAERYMPAMLTSIAEAKHYLLLEMYLVKPGALFDQWVVALQAAAERGVGCYLLFDDYGSLELESQQYDALVHRNIQFQRYNPLSTRNPFKALYRLFWRQLPQDLYRTHRKLLLVDGVIAFTGGTGICDEFTDIRFGPWRETMVSFRGPVLVDWQAMFFDSWPQPLTLPSPPNVGADQEIHCRLVTANTKRDNNLQQALLVMCNQAKQRIWLSTAYFTPSRKLRLSLLAAVKRGVDVRLLLPGPHIDHPSVRHAGRRFYTRLLRRGINIYEYQPRFLHSKALLCDDITLIGSSNFDRWGLRWNLEANLEISDPIFALQVEKMFQEDFAESEHYDYHQWCQRSWLLRLQERFWGRVELLLTRWSDRMNR